MSADNYSITDQNGIYFLTFTIIDWVDAFTRKEYKLIITDSLNYCVENKGLEIFAWCLMSNHLHMVCRAEEEYKISDIIRDFKKFSAKAIIREIEKISESRRDWLLYKFEYAGKFDNRIKKYKFWQETNHAILLDDNQKIEQRINYTHQNPVRALIVSESHDYMFSSARDYTGENGYVKVNIVV